MSNNNKQSTEITVRPPTGSTLADMRQFAASVNSALKTVSDRINKLEATVQQRLKGGGNA